jgi:hypothetical protein
VGSGGWEDWGGVCELGGEGGSGCGWVWEMESWVLTGVQASRELSMSCGIEGFAVR